MGLGKNEKLLLYAGVIVIGAILINNALKKHRATIADIERAGIVNQMKKS
jgi:hypothetical protein